MPSNAGTVDFAMGGGRQHFLPNGITDDEGGKGRRIDDRNLVEGSQGQGLAICLGRQDRRPPIWQNPVLGIFEASHMKYETDRTRRTLAGRDDRNGDQEPVGQRSGLLP